MNVLAGIDFADTESKVLDKAALYAEKLGAKLWLVHVAEPDPDFVGFEAGPQEVRDILAATFHKEHKQLQKMADDLQSDGRLVVEALLVQGEIAATIVKEAAKVDAEMIVVGSHGHGAMHQLLLGNTSEGVMHKSDRPVVIVPTHGRK